MNDAAVSAATAIIVALIAAISSSIAAWFAYKAAGRVKTPNGRETGTLVDDIAHKVDRLDLWMMEHLRDHANNATRDR